MKNKRKEDNFGKIKDIRKFKESIIHQYTIDKVSPYKIAKQYYTSPTTIYRILNENNVKTRSISESKKIYHINESVFNNISTEEQAYVLGFLYADGYNTNKKIGITVSLYDRDIVEKIRLFFESNVPLKIRNGRDIINTNYHGSPTINLTITSIFICKKLTELGVHHDKTYDLEFPDYLPDNLLKHFIRGYFDGDGCISKSKNNHIVIKIASTKKFLSKVQEICKNEINIDTHLYNISQINDSIGSFEIAASKDVKIFLDWIYKDANIYLNRKYNRYCDYYNGIEIEKYSKLSEEEIMSKYGYKDIVPIYD